MASNGIPDNMQVEQLGGRVNLHLADSDALDPHSCVAVSLTPEQAVAVGTKLIAEAQKAAWFRDGIANA
jgi:hypothetical protein